jgi:hypothetical protein
MSPLTIEKQHKHVFCHFGAVAARISDFEIVLTNILLANAKRSGRIVTDQEFEKMESLTGKIRACRFHFVLIECAGNQLTPCPFVFCSLDVHATNCRRARNDKCKFPCTRA